MVVDGKVRIDTQLDNSGAKKDLKDLEKSLDACSKHMQNVFENIDSEKNCEKAIQKQVNAYEKAKKKALEYEKEIERINSQIQEKRNSALKNANIGWNDIPESIQKRADDSLINDKDYNRLIIQAEKLENLWYAQKDNMDLANSNVEKLESTMERLKTKTNDTTKSGSKMSRVFSNINGIGSKIKDVFTSGFGKVGTLTKNLFNKINKSTTNSIKNIRKMGLAILGIRAAYSLVRKAADQYLEANQTASNKISAIWTTLGAMIGPIVDIVISGVVTALSYINALIKALTGIDFVAKANANALNEQSKSTKGLAKATKEANSQLADFDEMSKLEDKSNTGSSGTDVGANLFNPIDVGTSWIDGLKKAFDKGAYELGFYLAESLNGALEQINWKKIKDTSQSIGKNIALFINGSIDGINWNLLGSTFAEGLNTVLNFAYGFIANFNFRKFGEVIGTALASCIKTIDWNMLADIISNGFIGIFDSISGFLSEANWQDIGKTIAGFIVSINWGGILEAVTQSITLLAKGIIDLFVGAFSDLITSLPNITNSILEWINNIDWKALGKSLGRYVTDVISQLIDVILNTDWASVVVNVVGIIGKATFGMFDFIIGIVQVILDGVWVTISKAFNYKGFLKWIEGVVVAIQDGIADINKWINDKFMQARQAIYNIFGNIGEWFSQRYTDICNVFNNVDIWFKEKFNNTITKIKETFINIGNWFGERRNEINAVFDSVEIWFSEKFTAAWNSIKVIFSPETVRNFFNNCWNNIKGVFGNVTSWFRGTFTDAWQAVKNVFSAGGKIFDGIKDGILNGLKAVINALINGINKVIKIPFNGINSALKAIRKTEILGFKPFSWIGTISVPSIPKLAKGGIVNHPTMFVSGEAGKEAVLPLQNNTQWMQDLADFINSQRNESDSDKEINLYIDGERFFRWLIKKQKQYQFQTNG